MRKNNIEFGHLPIKSRPCISGLKSAEFSQIVPGMPVAIFLLPLALGAFAYCLLKSLKRFPEGPAAVAWAIGVSLISLLLIIALLVLREL